MPSKLQRKINQEDRALKKRAETMFLMYKWQIGQMLEKAFDACILQITYTLAHKENTAYKAQSTFFFHDLKNSLQHIMLNCAQEIEKYWNDKRLNFDLYSRIMMTYLDRKASPPWKSNKLKIHKQLPTDGRFDPGKGHFRFYLTRMADSMVAQVQRGSLNEEPATKIIMRVKNMFNRNKKKGVREEAKYLQNLTDPFLEDEMSLYGPVDIQQGFFDEADIAKLKQELIETNGWEYRQYRPWFTDELRANNRDLVMLEKMLMSDTLNLISSGQQESVDYLKGIDDMVWTVSRPGVCQYCDSRDGLTSTEIADKIKDDYEDDPPPLHPNCLIPGTAVSAAGISKHFKRWFSGKVITIRMAGNDNITITPNHSVLTNCGWKKASELNKNHSLVISLDDRSIVEILSPNNNQVKTAIEDIPRSLLMSGGVTATSVPVSSIDFHGDGIVNTEVDVIFSNRFLSNNRNTLFIEIIKKRLFSFWHRWGIIFNSLCSSFQILNRSFRATNSRLCFHGIGTPNFFRGSFGSIQSTLGHGSNTQSEFFKSQSNVTTMQTDSPSYINTRLAGHISLVPITDISISEYSGHVYNLQTEDKYYIANSVIVHNCNCEYQPQLSEAFKDQDLSEQGVKWDPETGDLTIPEDVRDKYRLDLNFDQFMDYLIKGG